MPRRAFAAAAPPPPRAAHRSRQPALRASSVPSTSAGAPPCCPPGRRPVDARSIAAHAAAPAALRMVSCAPWGRTHGLLPACGVPSLH
eukprot:5450123-Prymnesium_polylepis.1